MHDQEAVPKKEYTKSWPYYRYILFGVLRWIIIIFTATPLAMFVMSLFMPLNVDDLTPATLIFYFIVLIITLYFQTRSDIKHRRLKEL